MLKVRVKDGCIGLQVMDFLLKSLDLNQVKDALFV